MCRVFSLLSFLPTLALVRYALYQRLHLTLSPINHSTIHRSIVVTSLNTHQHSLYLPTTRLFSSILSNPCLTRLNPFRTRLGLFLAHGPSSLLPVQLPLLPVFLVPLHLLPTAPSPSLPVVRLPSFSLVDRPERRSSSSSSTMTAPRRGPTLTPSLPALRSTRSRSPSPWAPSESPRGPRLSLSSR